MKIKAGTEPEKDYVNKELIGVYYSQNQGI